MRESHRYVACSLLIMRPGFRKLYMLQTIFYPLVYMKCNIKKKKKKKNMNFDEKLNSSQPIACRSIILQLIFCFEQCQKCKKPFVQCRITMEEMS